MFDKNATKFSYTCEKMLVSIRMLPVDESLKSE